VKDSAQLDFATFVGIVRRRIGLVLGVAGAAAALAFFGSLLQSDRYEASADLLFHQDEPVPRVDPSEPPPDQTQSPEAIRATNLALASLDTVTVRVKQRLKSPLTLDELRDRVDLEPQGQADIVRVTATGDSRADAVRLANTFADEVIAFRRENSQRKVQQVIDAITAQLAAVPAGSADERFLKRRQQQLEVEKRLRTGDVEIAQEAIPPRDRSSPKPLRNGFIGGVLGFILGVILVLVMHRFDRRVHGEDEIPEIVGAPVIARIPVERQSGWEHELFIEAFQFLRANLQLRDREGRRRVIAITSALPGNGKSTIAARLAEALALSGSQVIVVDCDLRRPTLHEFFGVDGREGLTTALVGLRDPAGLLQATQYPSVRVLPAGPLMPMPASVLAGTQGIGNLLDSLRGLADYVIVDTSPVTIGADTSAIASAVDGTVLVVDVDSARRDVLKAATEQLVGARAEIIGVVLNRAEILLKDTAYRGYYGASGRSLFAEESGVAEEEQQPGPPPPPEPPQDLTVRRRRAASESKR
jgi:capsular exopolysaccharide synthesis family protein